MNLIDEIRANVEGAKILKEWIGEGLPVDQSKANGRALICLHGNEGAECPNHKAARWWETFKNPIADAIKSMIALKVSMNLSTPYDSQMKMCRGCGCSTVVKIWTPIEHIRNHPPPASFPKMPPYCWQVKEQS